MLRFFRLINQNCRLATRLVSDDQERPLTRVERCGLAIHLMGCRSCRRYRIQIVMLERLVKRASHDLQSNNKLSATARDRIQKRLENTGAH